MQSDSSVRHLLACAEGKPAMALLETTQLRQLCKGPGHIPSKPGDPNCRLNLAVIPRPTQCLKAVGPGPSGQGLCLRQPCYHTRLPALCRAVSACCSLTSCSEFPSSYLDDRLEGITEKKKHGYLPNPHYCFSRSPPAACHSLILLEFVVSQHSSLCDPPALKGAQDTVSASDEGLYLFEWELHEPLLVFLTFTAMFYTSGQC